MYRFFLLFLLYFFLPCSFIAQNQVNVDSEINKIDSIFASNFKSFSKPKVVLPTSQFIEAVIFKTTIPSSSYSENSFLEAKQKQLKSDIGLNFVSAYLGNSGSGLFNLEDNLIMKSRFQTGIEMDLLKGGLLENRSKAKAIKTVLKLKNSSLTKVEKNTIHERNNFVTHFFNQQKINILTKRSELISLLEQSEEILYTKRLVKREDIIETRQRTALIRAMMHAYAPYRQITGDLFHKSLLTSEISVFDINPTLILKALQPTNVDSLQSVYARDFSSPWVNKVKLSAFSRYNHYDMITSKDRSFYSFGVNVGIPIPFSASADQMVRKLELTKQIEEIAQLKQRDAEVAFDELYEFRMKIQQYVNLRYKKNLLEEQLRLADAKRSMKSKYYSPLQALKNIDDWYALQLEMVELKEQMYLKLFRISEHLPENELNELILPLDLPKILSEETLNHFSMYAWSSVFQEYEPNFLFQYLKYHEMNNVLIAYQKEDKLLTKKIELIRLLKENNQTVELLIGHNNLLFENDLERWFKDVFKQYENQPIESIHLDVEPHALKEWKFSTENKELLLKKYIDLLRKSAELVHEKGLKISVSIPLHFSNEIVTSIFEIVDGVTFMCYENVSVDYIARKLQPYKEFQEKTSIALRTEDFPSRSEIENSIKVLAQLTSIKKFVYHDLKRMIVLDTKELKR